MDLSSLNEGQLLLIDKPLTWTSFDVVKKLRYALKVKKIGHAGTLDPLATGLLLIATGKFTKKLQEIQNQDKEYTGIIEIGKTTPSYDLETDFDTETNWSGVNEEEVSGVVQEMIGVQEQFPPVFSAIKVGGERAYKKARRSEEVELKSREITIFEFEITKLTLPEIHFRIVCSKGTYIRSIASDVGKRLGVGAYLKALCRTKIGDFSLDKAYNLEALIEEVKAKNEDTR